MSRRLTPCALALGLVGLAGCAGPNSPVEGTVSVDGTPVDVGSIVFVPEGGGQPSGGDIRDGKYSIAEERGPAPGKYKVQITWNRKTGKKVKDVADTGETKDVRVQVLPDKFNKSTELTAEIKPGSNTVNFDLKAGKLGGKSALGRGAVGE